MKKKLSEETLEETFEQIEQEIVEEKSDAIPWEKLLKTNPDMVKLLAKNLNDRGLTSYQEVKNRGNEVISALQSAYAIDLSTIRQLAKDYEGENK